MPTTTLDFFRHGQIMHPKRFGFPDEPLTEEGRNQMWRAVGSDFPWKTIFSSPYARCAEFAHALGERARTPVVELAELRTLDWGAWTGKDTEEVKKFDAEALTRFDADPLHQRPTGGESLTDMANRATQASLTILERATGQPTLVIGHKWNIQATVANLLGMPLETMFSIRCDYASLTRLQFTGDQGRYLTSLVFHTGGV